MKLCSADVARLRFALEERLADFSPDAPPGSPRVVALSPELAATALALALSFLETP